MNLQKKTYIVLAKWMLFLFLIFLAFKLVNFDKIEDNILCISIQNFSIFLLLIALSKFLYAMRWQQICLKGLTSLNAPVFFFIRLNLLGEFVGIATPSALGGETVRVLKLNVLNIGKIRGTATIILDRMIGLGSMVIMVAFLLPIIGVTILPSIDLLSYRVFFLILCGLIVCITLFFILQKKFILESYDKVRAKIRFNFSLFLITIILSIIGHLIFVSGFYVLFLDIYPIPFLTTTVFILTSQITRSIPVSLLGIGLGEGTMIGLASLLEIKAESIFVIVVIALGARYLFACLGLLLELINDGKTILGNFK